MRPVRPISLGVLCALLLLPAGVVARTPSRATTALPAAPVVSLTLPEATAKQSIRVTVTVTLPPDTQVLGCFLSESRTTPAVDAAGWRPGPTPFTLSAGDGVKTVYAWVKDRNRSISARVSDTTLLDTGAPTATLTAPATSTSNTIAVTLGGADPAIAQGAAGSGIAAWAVVPGTTAPRLGGGAWKAVKPTTVVLPAGNGAQIISAFSRDAAGNVSAAATRTVTLNVPAPTLTFALPDYANKRAVNVTARPSDPGGTGIAGYYFSENGTPPAVDAAGWQLAPTPFTLSAGDGVKTVYAWAKDRNRSLSARVSDTTRLDTTAPTATLTAPATTSAATLTATVGGGDGTGSGITRYALVLGTTAPAARSADWVASASASVILNVGSNTVSAFTRDAAGNVSAAATRTVVYTP